ncbi:putative tetratricopeptide-like helical domain superfamily, DYW domain-containing protein [Helianthus annuus]|nr:putative tetratricopeptide-like helical domain superfamily, DYW domain-containing protein [Helianthus annuus]
MLLTTKTTTIFLQNPQIQTQKHLLIHHQNLKLHLNSPSKLPPRTKRIPATLSLTPHSNHHNADISRLCELGNLQKAIDLLHKSEKTILDDSKTYCHILQLCAESKALHHGKKVHNLISLLGVEIDSVLGSKLVFMYVSCGDLNEGRRVFDKIIKINVFLWNFMMNAYAKIGDYEESVGLFKMMVEAGVEPDPYTFSCVFKCVAAIGDDGLGEMVHGCVLKLGLFGVDHTVVNSVIAFYFKCGRVEDARKVFDKMPDRDVITWNTMISGYVGNGSFDKGFEVFKQMIGEKVSVDLSTMVIVVAACANMGVVKWGRMVHAYAVKGGFDTKMKFSNTLLDMYSKCGDMDSARKVFKDMNERSVVSWTSMIAGYARDGKSDDAISLFLEMKKEGVKPDTFTVTSILHACASNGSLEKGKEVHNYIKQNQIQSLAVSNALMDMYAKCGSMEDAYSVFSDTPYKDIVSWNTMIGGYSKNRLPNEALDLFIKMQREVTPDSVTMTCILPACASLAALNKGREIHAHVLRKGLTSDQYLVNTLIDMYVKCGRLFLAKSLFDITAAKNVVTWTVMIAGYCMHGFGHEAVSTFKNMREQGIKLNEASCTSILYACSHSGLVEEGWKFYNIMVNDYKIEPKLEHYSCMVDLLCRGGKLSDAYKFINKMTIKPDVTIWSALLCGCRFHHNVKLAEIVAERIFELEPENMEYYVLLANIYSEAEKWEEVKTLRDGIRNNRGCSWIEIKGKVNIFVAGNKDNPEAKRIEYLLENLRMEMTKDGFSRKLKYSLVDKDEIEEEAAGCGHSEMLAIGFGLLKLPHGRTIRVTKNGKVCGECHEMAKFISKNVGRQIVLRDCNRFHHFKHGFCSCRGY